MSKESFEDLVFNDDAKNTALLFEQYKLYVEMMDKTSERRHQANSFFLTVNTALVTILTGFVSIEKQATTNYGSLLIISAIAGVTFCITWRRLIRSYGQLNSGKFKVIHALEKRLPANLFKAEWEALNHGDGTLYKPFTNVEVITPIVFAILYLTLATLSIAGNIF